MKKLQQKRNKALYPCEFCDGSGEVYLIRQEMKPKECHRCSGFGYIVPFEFGCEIIHMVNGYTKRTSIIAHIVDRESQKIAIRPPYRFSTVKYIWSKDVIKNLGKPFTLSEILLMLEFKGDARYESTVIIGNKLRLVKPTNKKETTIEEGVGINNEQYGTVTNNVWLDIKIDLTKPLSEQPEVINQLNEIL